MIFIIFSLLKKTKLIIYKFFKIIIIKKNLNMRNSKKTYLSYIIYFKEKNLFYKT